MWGGGERGSEELLLGGCIVIVVGLEGIGGGVEFAVVVVVGAVEVEIERGGLDDCWCRCGLAEMIGIVLWTLMDGQES